jgi:hypothetical protein
MSNFAEIQISNALAVAQILTGPLKTLLDGGFIHIYAGTPPAGPEEAKSSNTLLCTLTLGHDGTTGLTFDTTATNGIMKKPSAADWSGINVATGTATFWRWNMGADDNSAVAGSNYRMQGLCGTDAAFSMFLSSTALVSANTFSLDSFQYIVPAGA